MVANATVLHSAVCCNKRKYLPNDLSAYVMEPHRHTLCNWKILFPISDRLKTKKERVQSLIQRHLEDSCKCEKIGWIGSGEEGEERREEKRL